jgi:hypothetical protein
VNPLEQQIRAIVDLFADVPALIRNKICHVLSQGAAGAYEREGVKRPLSL